MEIKKVSTMEEFASASGVSRPTVSKFFNDPMSVRRATRERIERALERFDYRPNIFAVNQNRRQTKNIGIVVPVLSDPVFAEFARLIERRCIDAGYFPLVFSSHGQKNLEISALETLQSLKPAGVMMAPLGRRSDLEAVRIFTEEVPTVLFDSNLEVGEAFVGHNNIHSTGLIVDYLSRTGEPPCFFEMRIPPNPNAIKRRNAYIDAMERLGLAPDIIQIEGESWEFEHIGNTEGVRLISEHAFPSSTILCSNDRLAIGLLAAAYEKGLRVGRGPACALRIAGHDDHPFSRFTCPPLTTVSHDYASIAEKSADTLFGLLESGGTAESREETLFDGKLVLRASA